eukprot:jgi/Botrbrau1/1539/Bobra.0107s0027.1
MQPKLPIRQSRGSSFNAISLGMLAFTPRTPWISGLLKATLSLSVLVLLIRLVLRISNEHNVDTDPQNSEGTMSGRANVDRHHRSPLRQHGDVLATPPTRSSRSRTGASVSESEAHVMCEGTIGGDWCQQFHSQTPILRKAPPRGKQRCLNDCNGAGICNWDLGVCSCIAGWGGDYCQYREARPCTSEWRKTGYGPAHTLTPLDSGWTASRCFGVCDEDVALCFCNGTYGHIPGPPEVPPLYRDPVQMGRTLTYNCMPVLFDNGKPTNFGRMPNENLFGPEGWCEAEKNPKQHCHCSKDGWAGALCDIRVEAFCLNQCSGHGDCLTGFCRCHKGYYGHDCARRIQGFPELPGLEKERPWLNVTILPSAAAADPPTGEKVLRPLIYVYDLPPDYNVRLLQYRNTPERCVHRLFNERNNSVPSTNAYTLETGLHEMLLQSVHRTLDPEEADFFYVPVYTSCFSSPIFGWADHPWYYFPNGLRVQHMSMMALEAKRWVQNHMPYWNRRGGSDHIWLFTHDEASCWVPEEIYNTSIILSHWGRKDKNHLSNTAYNSDNYTDDFVNPWSNASWRGFMGHHPCYEADLNKDLLVPVIKAPQTWSASPYLGAPKRNRTYLLTFIGEFRERTEPKYYLRYSRFIRQSMKAAARNGDWLTKHGILIGLPSDIPKGQTYETLLASSVFCLVPPGDGFSTRARGRHSARLHPGTHHGRRRSAPCQCA